jgi:subtilisin family serine protease
MQLFFRLQVNVLLGNIVLENYQMDSKIIPRFIACVLLFINISASAQNATIISGNIIVMVHSNEEAQQLSTIFSYINGIQTHLKIKSTLSKNMNIFLFEFDSTAINQELLLSVIKTNPLVKIAQFNHTIELRNEPNDSLFSLQWNMNNTGQKGGTAGVDIAALKAWDISTGGLTAEGDTIVVAVVDEGFDLLHEDLNFWKNHHEIPNNHIDDDRNGYVDDYLGWNSSSLNDTLPVQDHGTHICGIIGAKGCNLIGVTGVNRNVKIMPVSTDGQTEANIVASYSYVVEQRRQYNQTNGAKGAFVVASSSSFGLDLAQAADHPLWCAMYDSLGSVGILSAAATTNNNYNVDTQGDMPTSCSSKWLITVTNTTNTDAKATAGYGTTTIDLGAPGTEIPSTITSNNYGYMTGTSMSAPHVAGAVALMYSVGCTKFMSDYKNNSSAMALIVKDSLLNATDKISALEGITVTGGRLNLFKAVQSIVHYSANSSCVFAPTICPPDTNKTNLKNPANIGFAIRNVYPNPTNGILNISYECNEDAVINLYNMMGEKIQSLNVNQANVIQKGNFDLSTTAKGIYFINMSNSNGRSASFKVVVAPDLLKP